MTTRGAWGLVIDGRAIVSPHAAEPTPSALGARVLEWAREQQSWGEVRVRAQCLQVADEGPDRRPAGDPRVRLRGAPGRPRLRHEACEWAYLVDLDDDALEVYAGRPAKGTPPVGRFWDDRPDWEAITRVAVFSLYALPTTDQFVAQLHGLAQPRPEMWDGRCRGRGRER